MDTSFSSSSHLKVAGFDPGRNYIAWALLEGSLDDGFSLTRHGIIYPYDLGDTRNFGVSLPLWAGFFRTFLKEDLQADVAAVERFIKMRGGAGGAAEDICLRVAHMAGPGMWLVRNVDWKSYVKRHFHPEGSVGLFGTPTEHEADAAGIALYLATALLPRCLSNSPTTGK